MAYQKLEFIDGVTTLKAEHLQHIEEGICNALTIEKQLLFTDTIISEGQTIYWTPGFIQTPTPSLQTFTDKIAVSIVGNYATTVTYATSPLYRLQEKSTILKWKDTVHFVRQFHLLTKTGGKLVDLGSFSALSATDILGAGQGFTEAVIKSFIGDPTNQELYPNLTSSMTTTSIILNAETIAELNRMYKVRNANAATYQPGEVVYLVYNIKVDSVPPSDLEQLAKWVEAAAEFSTLTVLTSLDVFELPGLRMSDDILKSYDSPVLESILLELDDTRKILGMSDVEIEERVNRKIYSSATTSDFYPSIGHDKYLASGCKVTSFDPLAYGGLTTYAGYKVTIPIPLEISDSATYETSGFLRHFCFLDSKGNQLYYGQNVSTALTLDKKYFDSISVDSTKVKYLCVSNTGANLDSFKVTRTSVTTTSTYTLPSLKLTEEQQAGGGGTSTGASNIIDLTNVDRIVAIGDSYTESHYTIKDKSWISKVSLMSDYNMDNFAISGDTYRGQLNKIRKGSYAYASKSGMTWEKLHPTHALMISKTNDTKYMDCQQFIYDMMATVDVTRGLGAIPIIATEYHVSSHDFVQTAFNYCAKLSGGYYVDLTEKDYAIRGNDYAPFWGGSHPGTRSNHLFSDVITKFINTELPRPYASIKIFRPRDLATNFDDYLFSTILQRASKFKEISICHSALKDSSLYDTCTNQANSKVESEYFKLIAGQLVSFDKVCLIDAILPTTVHDVTQVLLNVTVPSGVLCYVKDVMAEPYPSPAFCRRFDIPLVLTSTQVAVGNTYTSNKTSGTTYKVVEILYDKVESNDGFIDGTILICSGNRVTSAYNGSTLTLTSGTGDSVLACSYEAVGLSSDYPAGKQDVGHYVQTETFGLLEGDMLRRGMDHDKVTFLLVSDSEFTIQNLSISFKGNITKQRDTINYNKPYEPYYHENSSVLPVKTFDSSNISKWLKAETLAACTLTPGTPADSCMPSGITLIVTLSPEDGSIVQALSTITPAKAKNTRKKVRIWARYFPPIFDPTTMSYPDEAPINDNSFDWATLNIELYLKSADAKKGATVKLEQLVGLHWVELEEDLLIPPTSSAQAWHIGVSAKDKPIQLAFIDVV